MNKRAAFSLIELLIVAAIIADLAVIALPSYLRARRTAQNARFTADLRVAASAFEMYATEKNRYPAETAAGVVPPGMNQYLRGVQFSAVNSLSGRWDWDYDQGYAKAAVCVELPGDADPIQMVDIDTRIDNGILSTGAFRERNPRRYAYIIE